MTIADLGIAVDSKPAAQAVVDLDKLAAAARRTETATRELTGATQSAAKVQGAHGAAAGANSAQVQAMGHVVRSMAEQMALGVSPVQALTGQLSHLSFLASGQGGLVGALKGVGAAFAPLLTVPNLVGIGILGLTTVVAELWGTMSGGGAQAAEDALKRQKAIVDDLAEAFPKIGKALKEFLAEGQQETTASIFVRSEREIRAAQAQVEGLTKKLDILAKSGGNVSGGISPLSFDPKVLQQVQDLVAQFDAGAISALTLKERLSELELNPALSGLLKASIQDFGTLAGQIANANSVAAAFGSTLDALRAQGGLIIGGDFSKLGADTQKAFDSFQSVIASGVSEKDKLKQLFDKGMGGATTLADQNNLKHQYELALKTLDQKAAEAASLKAQGAFTSTTNAIEKQIVALRSEADTLGKSVSAVESAKTAEQLLTAAKQDHLAITPKLIAQINAEADAYGKAAQALKEKQVIEEASFARSQIGRTAGEQGIASTLRGVYGDDVASHMDGAIAGQLRLNQALQEGKDLATSFGSTIITDFRQGKSVTDTLADAFGNLGQQLLQMAMNQAIAGLFSNLIGGALGGGGGLHAGYNLGGGGGLLSNLFGHNAAGTENWGGGLTWIGEQGAELVDLPRGSQVASHSRSMALAANSNSANDNPSVHITINAPNATREGVTALQQWVSSGAFHAEVRRAVRYPGRAN